MNYEQKLMERAEEFAKECEHMAGSFPASIIDLARLSLQREAEAYTLGRAKGYDLGIEWAEGKPITVTPNLELQSLGLVP